MARSRRKTIEEKATEVEMILQFGGVRIDYSTLSAKLGVKRGWLDYIVLNRKVTFWGDGTFDVLEVLRELHLNPSQFVPPSTGPKRIG